MKDKKIAIYLVITVLIFAMIIGIATWFVIGKKQIKNNNISQNDTNSFENTNIQARTLEHTYENSIYIIELYSDGTATAKIKSDFQLWGDLETSEDENYKKEKNELKAILTQGRQIDSNKRKIEEVFITNYIGDIYNNYNYGKAIIKCEGNVFYLLDLVSDKKIRIAEDWTEKCREVNSDRIVINLQNECLAEVLNKQTVETNYSFTGVRSDNKYKYVITFDENGEYGVYVHSVETDELLLYGTGKIADENTEVAAGTSYYKFSFAKPNGGSINGIIKQSNVIADDANDSTKQQNTTESLDQTADKALNVLNTQNPLSLEIEDISAQSNANYSTNGYIELKNK